MRIELDTQPELKTSEYREPTTPILEESSSEKLPGAKISPSKIETLSTVFNQYNSAEDKDRFLDEILDKKPIDKEKVLKNAEKSVDGTLLHQLQYLSSLFLRAARLGRIPNQKDFRATFPNKRDYYYESLMKILDQTIERGISEDPISNAINFWEEWKLHGQDFAPKRHKNYIIDPDEIRNLWENQTISSEDIELFKLSYERSRIENKVEIPNSTLLINETFLLQNILFPKCNLQVHTSIDEIQIPRKIEGEPMGPIKIIDYKTGKQFEKLGFREKVQIFLMTLSVYITMTKKIVKKEIDYSFDQWDISHNTNRLQLPRLKNNSLLQETVLLSSLHSDVIPGMGKSIKEHVAFSYVNPLTQEEKKIDLNDIFLKDMGETERILAYLNRLTMFYIQHKDVLKHKLNGKTSPYTLPTFPREGFLEGKDPLLQDSPQLALNI